MESSEGLEAQSNTEPNEQALALLARYASTKDTLWVARVDPAEETPGPRSWHRTHGVLIVSGWLEPGFAEETNGIPQPAYRVTRAGRKECERLVSLIADKPASITSTH